MRAQVSNHQSNKNKLRVLSQILISVGMLSTTPIRGESVTGCSFYRAPFASTFLSCAKPTATYGGCTKTRYVGVVPVTYPAVKLEMWLPEYLIEVTEEPGTSKFKYLSPTLTKHMSLATDWYSSHAQGGNYREGQGGISESGKSYFWHARAIEIPYGYSVLNYPNMRASGAVAAPLCYTAISELVPDQWHLGLSELILSETLMSTNLSLCYADSTGILTSGFSEGVEKAKSETLTAFAGTSDFDTSAFTGFNCSKPVNNKWAAMKAVAGDAAKPENLCMNSLGPLLPRVGHIDGEEKYQTAIIASWKFSSLSKDIFDAKNLGILGSDQWQMLYPKSTRIECFKPGVVYSDFIGGPTEMREPGANGDGHYIFAVWRKREACEDLNGAFWKAEVLGLANANKAMCAMTK